MRPSVVSEREDGLSEVRGVYDRGLLEEWAKMESWGDYMQRKGVLAAGVSTERFREIGQGYDEILERRIRYCNEILKAHPDDPFVHFVLAKLWDHCNPDGGPEHLFKRWVRYHCRQALRINPDYVEARSLLADVDEWAHLLGDDSRRKWG